MTSVAAAPEEARKEAQDALEELRNAIRAYLEAHDRKAALHDLIGYLLADHVDVQTSRALALMLSTGELALTPSREILLASAP